MESLSGLNFQVTKRENVMLIGELSRYTGASRKAIRLYESRGLLPTVGRQGSYRVYNEAHVRQVRMIRQAQALGFRLSELGFLMYPDNGEPDWNAVLEELGRKRGAIRRDMRMLKRLEAQLEQTVSEIRGCIADTSHSIISCEGFGDSEGTRKE